MFRSEYNIIKKSGLFDEVYYYKHYEDVRKADIDSIKHYIKYGWKEGRNPSKNFDTNLYLVKYPELKEKNICPLLHKILEGKNTKNKEKRNLLKNIFLNFSKLKKHLNIHNFKRLIYHIKKGNFSFINEKIFFYTNTEVKKIQLDLEEKKIDYNLEKLEFQFVENPLVSIIIPVYNQFDFTFKCLKSILEKTTDVSYEIIIADDVSSDETINILKYIKNIKVVRNEKNLGFLLNCNNAAKYARGKYIHLLNNDTQVQKEWLSSLVELIESDENTGMVGSKLVYPDGRQQEAGGIIWNDASGWNFGRLDDPNKPEYNYVKEVDYISGASIMLSKNLWNKIGGFDERYVPAYFEDSDLAFEVRRHGYKVMFQPKSIVVHFEGISHGTDTGTGIKAYQVKNRSKFIEKWKNELEKNHFPNAQNVFLARDRSKDKKHILVIDHYVPHYDQDAGSRTIWQYLKLFTQMDYKVTFIGDNFYNYPDKPYVKMLEQSGIEVLYGVYYQENWEEWLKNNSVFIDYVFLSRPHISKKYINEIKLNTDAKIFYYGHDLHYLRVRREGEIYKINNEKDVNYWYEIEKDLVSKSDVVLTLSEVEKIEIENEFKHNNVVIMPTFIYEKILLTENSYLKRNDIMFVGGFAHTPNIQGILWFVENIWHLLHSKLPDIKLYIIGSKPTDEILKLNSENIIVTGYIDDEELEKYYHNCKVAIAPLLFGAGVKGKVVESIAMQIPTVATTIAAEGLPDIDNVLIVKDDAEEFMNSLIEVYENEDYWNEISTNSYEYAKKNFTDSKIISIFK